MGNGVGETGNAAGDGDVASGGGQGSAASCPCVPVTPDDLFRCAPPAASMRAAPLSKPKPSPQQGPVAWATAFMFGPLAWTFHWLPLPIGVGVHNDGPCQLRYRHVRVPFLTPLFFSFALVGSLVCQRIPLGLRC